MVKERMARGPLPVLLQFADPTSEYAHLAAEIQQLLSSGFQPSDILMASRRRNTLNKLAGTLQDHNIPASVMTQTAGLDDSSVKVSTLHGAKGLEFPVVFICGLEGLNDNQDSEREAEIVEAEERRLLYVGMTRARERLYVSYHGQIPAWVLKALQTEMQSGEAEGARSQ
jgi:superfamily I DNA/RNA helicase